MTTPGPIALLGGLEHREGTEPIERTLLDLTGVAAPRVAVLPVASSGRQVGMVAALARTYWSGLGADVRVALPDGNGSGPALDAVAGADVVVLTGGVPNRLVAALGASPVWEAALQRWHDGAALVGSSAGAMSLFRWRLRLYPPHPLALVPGLGPLDGWVVAPHFSRFRAERYAAAVARRFGGLGVLGIDERTGLVGRGDRFTVVGDGTVTLVNGGLVTAHTAGTALRLRLQTPATPTPATPAPAAEAPADRRPAELAIAA